MTQSTISAFVTDHFLHHFARSYLFSYLNLITSTIFISFSLFPPLFFSTAGYWPTVTSVHLGVRFQSDGSQGSTGGYVFCSPSSWNGAHSGAFRGLLGFTLTSNEDNVVTMIITIITMITTSVSSGPLWYMMSSWFHCLWGQNETRLL